MTGPHNVHLKWTKPKRPNYFARIARYNKRLINGINDLINRKKKKCKGDYGNETPFKPGDIP